MCVCIYTYVYIDCTCLLLVHSRVEDNSERAHAANQRGEGGEEAGVVLSHTHIYIYIYI